MRTAKPALNIYTAPNSGFEFAFHTEDGKISAVISVALLEPRVVSLDAAGGFSSSGPIPIELARRGSK